MTSSGTAFEAPEPHLTFPERGLQQLLPLLVRREVPWDQNAAQTQRKRGGHAPDGGAPRELKLWWGKDFQRSSAGNAGCWQVCLGRRLCLEEG